MSLSRVLFVRSLQGFCLSLWSSSSSSGNFVIFASAVQDDPPDFLALASRIDSLRPAVAPLSLSRKRRLTRASPFLSSSSSSPTYLACSLYPPFMLITPLPTTAHTTIDPLKPCILVPLSHSSYTSNLFAHTSLAPFASHVSQDLSPPSLSRSLDA